MITSNTKIDDLYKEGLQREQFLPFISIINKNSIQKELVLEGDYRKLGSNKLERAFYPINKKNKYSTASSNSKGLSFIKIDAKASR